MTLTARRVTYRFGGRPLVRDIDLHVAPGTFTVVVGPNGAGKSTLLKLLAGEIRPHSGEVLLDGRPLPEYAPWELACRRAVMSQATMVSFAFTVLEVARLGLEGVGRGLSGADRERIAMRALRRADVAHLAGRSLQHLSGGEQQRVHYARTLAQLDAGRTACGGKSQIVFLDEPVASLDLKHQLGLIEEAMRLARSGLAVIAIMHDLQLATQCADRLLVLREGRCVADGRPEDVLTAAIIRSVFEVALPEEPPSRLPWAMIGADGPQGFGEVGPDAAPANAAEE